MSALETLKKLQGLKVQPIKLPDSDAVVHVRQLSPQRIFQAGVVGREIQKESGEPVQDLKARLIMLAAAICEEDGSEPQESVKELLDQLEVLPMVTAAYLLDQLQAIQNPAAAEPVVNEDAMAEAVVEQAKKSEAVPSSDSTAASDS